MTTETASPAVLLREAASRMRELAQAATPGSWHVIEEDDQLVVGPARDGFDYCPVAVMPSDPDDPATWMDDRADAEHIASWHDRQHSRLAHDIACKMHEEGLGDRMMQHVYCGEYRDARSGRLANAIQQALEDHYGNGATLPRSRPRRSRIRQRT